MENVKFTKGPWYRQAISDRIRILTGTGMAKRVIAVLKDSALPQEQIIGNSYLIAAAPLGYELAEAIIAQVTDGLDRSDFILTKAKEFIAKAGGNHAGGK